MNPEIIFPNTHGKDTALYALEYQRALLDSLAYTFYSDDNDIDNWQRILWLCQALTKTAAEALQKGGDA